MFGYNTKKPFTQKLSVVNIYDLSKGLTMQTVSSLFSSFYQAPILPNIATKEDFISVLKSKDFVMLQEQLKSFFTKLPPSEQDLFLTEATIIGFEENNQDLLKRCLNLLNFKEMQTLLVQAHGQIDAFNHALKCRQDLYQFCPIEPSTHIKQTLQSEIKQGIPHLFSIVISFINTLIYSTNLLELGKQPESAWDANFQLQVYYQILAIPIALFFALQSLITSPILVIAAFSATLLGLLISLYAYLRWLQPPPTKLPYAQNITLNVIQGLQGPVSGRDTEIHSLINILGNRSSKIRKHPI
ncbi:MAG: hypothetical protein H0W89_08200, partial [Candidatus Levybacteria bacterium]|nr:hypothetical protein [Candidatus Levybacteria bacterium]